MMYCASNKCILDWVAGDVCIVQATNASWIGLLVAMFTLPDSIHHTKPILQKATQIGEAFESSIKIIHLPQLSGYSGLLTTFLPPPQLYLSCNALLTADISSIHSYVTAFQSSSNHIYIHFLFTNRTSTILLMCLNHLRTRISILSTSADS